jgi:hypothetical protein
MSDSRDLADELKEVRRKHFQKRVYGLAKKIKTERHRLK